MALPVCHCSFSLSSYRVRSSPGRPIFAWFSQKNQKLPKICWPGLISDLISLQQKTAATSGQRQMFKWVQLNASRAPVRCLKTLFFPLTLCKITCFIGWMCFQMLFQNVRRTRNGMIVARLAQRTVSIASKRSFVQGSAWLAVSAKRDSFLTRKTESVFQKSSARLSTPYPVSLL